MEHHFTSGVSNYTIQCVRGKVVGKDKNFETKVSGGGGGGYTHKGTGGTAPVVITSRTVIHDKIYLEHENGKQKALELTDWDVACLSGHDLMAVWLLRDTSGVGPYVAMKNFTTEGELFNNGAIRHLADQHYKWLRASSGSSGTGRVIIGVGIVAACVLLYNIGGQILLVLGVAALIAYEFVTRSKTEKVAKAIKQELKQFLNTQN